MHNYYRSLHSSPPLVCDHQLAKSAQKWTDQPEPQMVISHNGRTNILKVFSGKDGDGREWIK